MAARNGATRLMSLSPISLMRALRQLGFDAERIAEPYLNEGDGRRYAVLSMSATAAQPRQHTPAATHMPQGRQPVHAAANAGERAGPGRPRRRSALAKNAGEDRVDVFGMITEVEFLFDFGR